MEVHVRDDYGDVPCDNCPARCECVGCEMNRDDFTDITEMRRRHGYDEKRFKNNNQTVRPDEADGRGDVGLHGLPKAGKSGRGKSGSITVNP